MMLLTVVQYVPWIVTAAVLGGVAFFGWRRTRVTGALLIAIAACMQILDVGVSALAMYWTIERHTSYSATMTITRFVATGGHLVSSVLLIVGVALLIQRLPTAQPRK
jgi:hypothetical protein